MLDEVFLVAMLPSAVAKSGGAGFEPFFLFQGLRKRRWFCVVLSLFPVLFKIPA